MTKSRACPRSRRGEGPDGGTGDLFATGPRLAVESRKRRLPKAAPVPLERAGFEKLPARLRRALAGPEGMDALKHAGKRALLVLLAVNFLGYATIGSNGVFRWSGYQAQKNERLGALSLLDAEHARLVHHIGLLDPQSADTDLVEEMIRTQLGLIRPDEVIILDR